MNAVVSMNLIRCARRSSFYVLIVGIATVILLPIVFLVSLSLMSDYEAYQWPFPLAPSLSVDFKLERSGSGCMVSIYNRTSGKYETFVESDDVDRMVAFLAKQANCSVSRERLSGLVADLSGRDEVRFSLRKRLLANYRKFFSVTGDALPAVIRSVNTALLTIVISLSLGGTAGYAFARYSFKGRGALRLSVLFVRIFPGVAVAIPMVVILANMGLYDKPLGLALVYSVGQIALTMWITASIFVGIPVELEEAARVFGCTRAGAFMHVTLPLALPGLAACAMYAFIASWNETIQAIVLTQSNPTFPVVIYETLVGSKGMVNLATAGGVAMALPAVLFTLIIRKYVLRMWGGVKL